MKSRFAQLFLIAFFVICVLSCNVRFESIFSRYGLTFTEPPKDEIVGIWVADESTRRKYLINSSPKFIFQDDGNFQMVDMPNWWKDGFGESPRNFETNSGKWKLWKDDCCWRISLDFPNLSTGVGLREHRFNGQPKYIITIGLGDPDSGNEMIFVKQQ